MSNVALPFKSNGDTTAPSSSVSQWALSPLVASLALTVSACGFFDEREPTVYALLVGIDDYPGFFNDLRGPVEDVRRLTEVLTGRFGVSEANIMTLTDSDATRMNIANSVVQHLGKAGPDDVAVFFYSGHGTQIGTNIGVTGPSDAEEGGEGDEALVVYGPSRKSSLLLDEELGFLIESIDAGRSMVVVDACFSGDITRGPSDAPRPKLILADDAEFRATLNIPTDFIAIEISLSIGMPSAPAIRDSTTGFGDLAAVEETLRRPQRHIMWSSSTEDQVSWTTSLGAGTSLFTHYLAQHLETAPLESTLAEVAQSVFQDVQRYTEEHDNMSAQHPQIRRHSDTTTIGDFFAVR